MTGASCGDCWSSPVRWMLPQFAFPLTPASFTSCHPDECRSMIALAVEHVSGRVPVVAQANSVSAVQATALARFAQEAGATAVAVAVPRQFAVREQDLLRYFDRILKSIDIPLLIQDFNPGGPTVSPEWVARLHRMHPHFRWVKLEEPMMASRVRSILRHRRRGGSAGGSGAASTCWNWWPRELLVSCRDSVPRAAARAHLPAGRSGHMRDAYDIYEVCCRKCLQPANHGVISSRRKTAAGGSRPFGSGGEGLADGPGRRMCGVLILSTRTSWRCSTGCKCPPSDLRHAEGQAASRRPRRCSPTMFRFCASVENTAKFASWCSARVASEHKRNSPARGFGVAL